MRHRVFVYDRGGTRRIMELTDIASVTWGRVRDDTSEAEVTVAAGCVADIALVEPGRHELVIYRDTDRVWEGPITTTSDQRASFTITARDVTWYLNRTIMHDVHDNSYRQGVESVLMIDRQYTIMAAELARKEALDPPINVVPYITRVYVPPDADAPDPKTAKKTHPFQMYVFEELDSAASRGGIDFTVVGRAIYLWSTQTTLGRTPTMTQADIIGDIIVTSYGAQLATLLAVTDGEGRYGYAETTVDGHSNPDPYYGEWEVLYTTENEEDDEDAPTVTEMTTQATAQLKDRIPTPVSVRIPANSTLAADSAITVDMLVPGVGVPLRATLTARAYSQMNKLDAMRVRETAEGETVTVTLSSTNAVTSEVDEGGLGG